MQEYIIRGLARKILILCPPSLVQQWENEMKRKFNQDFIRSDDSGFKKMGKEAWAHYPKVIASIAMAKRKEHREIICDQHYDLIIVDEAHHIKNRNTQAWKKKLGFKVAEFHGGLRRKEKEDQVTYFREEADVLVSTEVGGEGRNLQFCHGMINYDIPWNPMAIEQRIGRIHRIGQEKDVYVYNLVAKQTIEHHILNLLDRKINMFELVVGEVDMILGDIEEKNDFADLVMDAWVKSDTAKS
ncbi:DEAD/DEAH box helicase [Alkalihalobacillus sp. BA299]|uniref:DEAD/DEAH box helicase n=1 Tax=Alkalihalobacillus sp. BA299 TaxID=2815938 RepID=UPI001FFE274B|nr:DEAD/DEAH box helicase [Alkalihalobacillus sp. BA299]